MPRRLSILTVLQVQFEERPRLTASLPPQSLRIPDHSSESRFGPSGPGARPANFATLTTHPGAPNDPQWPRCCDLGPPARGGPGQRWVQPRQTDAVTARSRPAPTRSRHHGQDASDADRATRVAGSGPLRLSDGPGGTSAPRGGPGFAPSKNRATLTLMMILLE